MITTVGIFSNQTDAESALIELRASGIQENETSYITADTAEKFSSTYAGLGIGDDDAARFHEYLRSGDIIITVCLANAKPKDIFTRTHAREIQEYAQ